MVPKLRRGLPMFNFEHRFEILTPTAPWLTAAREGTRVAAPATEPRPEPQRLAETVHGHVVIVTGGATGVGRPTAPRLAPPRHAVASHIPDLPRRAPGPPPPLPAPALRPPRG